MNLPRLLTGHTMTPKAMLRPVSMSLKFKVDGQSTASMVLDAESETVSIGDWVQIWAPNGETCVMFVTNKQTDYISGQVTISLEHVFRLMETMVIFGEVTPQTMGGSETAVAIGTAISYLLSQQSEQLFQLGTCDFNTSQGWKFTNSDIYSALHSLTDTVQDCQWEFNFATFPWTVSLKAWPTTTTMEMRRNRNVSSMKITLDRSSMFTRAYPMGKNNLHIDDVNNNVSYLDRNTATWGVVAAVIMDGSIGDAALLKAWAEAQLKKNAEPAVTVSITGLELSESTGESLDRLVTGRLCRVPLPEYDTYVTERLVELSWKNAIGEQKNITCTLANEHKTMSGILYEITTGNGSSGARGGGGGKKSNIERECELGEDEEKIEEFENADIWINRDSVWAVCGSYEVITTSSGKVLRVKDGTALTLMRNGTEWGLYDEGNLTGGICIRKINNNGDTSLKISATEIDIDGIINSLEAKDVMVANFNAANGQFTGDLSVLGDAYFLDVSADDFECNSLKVGGYTAEWKNASYVTYNLGTYRYFLYSSSQNSTTPIGATGSYPITGYDSHTIYYLGHT